MLEILVSQDLARCFVSQHCERLERFLVLRLCEMGCLASRKITVETLRDWTLEKTKKQSYDRCDTKQLEGEAQDKSKRLKSVSRVTKLVPARAYKERTESKPRRKAALIFGRYLIVRYLGNPAIQNIDQILPQYFATRQALVWYHKRLWLLWT